MEPCWHSSDKARNGEGAKHVRLREENHSIFGASRRSVAAFGNQFTLPRKDSYLFAAGSGARTNHSTLTQPGCFRNSRKTNATTPLFWNHPHRCRARYRTRDRCR
jgi:hypothetical protein